MVSSLFFTAVQPLSPSSSLYLSFSPVVFHVEKRCNLNVLFCVDSSHPHAVPFFLHLVAILPRRRNKLLVVFGLFVPSASDRVSRDRQRCRRASSSGLADQRDRNPPSLPSLLPLSLFLPPSFLLILCTSFSLRSTCTTSSSTNKRQTTTRMSKRNKETVLWALHSFEAENDDELGFNAGERIILLERDDLYGDGWFQVSPALPCAREGEADDEGGIGGGKGRDGRGRGKAGSGATECTTACSYSPTRSEPSLPMPTSISIDPLSQRLTTSLLSTNTGQERTRRDRSLPPVLHLRPPAFLLPLPGERNERRRNVQRFWSPSLPARYWGS